MLPYLKLIEMVGPMIMKDFFKRKFDDLKLLLKWIKEKLIEIWNKIKSWFIDKDDI